MFDIILKGILSELNKEDGYIKLTIGEECKYYNFKFEEKTETEMFPSRTLFLSKQDGKYGYVDKNGKVVVDYIYDDAREQNQYGFAAVKKDGLWGSIDKNGKITVTKETLEQCISKKNLLNMKIIMKM